MRACVFVCVCVSLEERTAAAMKAAEMFALPFRRCLRRQGQHQHQREDEREEKMRGDDGGGASSSSLSFASKDDALAYLHVCNVKPRSADVAGPLEAERCLLVTGVFRAMCVPRLYRNACHNSWKPLHPVARLNVLL